MISGTHVKLLQKYSMQQVGPWHVLPNPEGKNLSLVQMFNRKLSSCIAVHEWSMLPTSVSPMGGRVPVIPLGRKEWLDQRSMDRAQAGTLQEGGRE